MKKKKSLFHDDAYGDLNFLGWIVAIVAICSLVVGAFAVIGIGTNIAWVEGVETTVTGSIQLHQLKYDRFWKLEYTDVEMRTYSGDTHHISVKGHVPLEYGSTYTITYVVRNYWAHLYLVNEVVKIELLPPINGSITG